MLPVVPRVVLVLCIYFVGFDLVLTLVWNKSFRKTLQHDPKSCPGISFRKNAIGSISFCLQREGQRFYAGNATLHLPRNGRVFGNS